MHIKISHILSIAALIQSQIILAVDKVDSSNYPSPLTIENISESDKKDPNKVVEALVNTFIEALQPKEYTEAEIFRSTQIMTSIACIQYDQMSQIESFKEGIQIWNVYTNWIDRMGENQVSRLEIKASTKDFATGYAMCELWKSKHIPFDRFTGFRAVKVPVHAKLKD